MKHSTKILLSITTLVVVVILAGVFSGRTLASSSKKIENQIETVEKNVKDGKWKEADSALSNAKEIWSSSEKIWTILIDHIEIDNIDTGFERLSSFLETKSTPLALGEISSLRQYIRHIPEKEIPSIKNIF